VKRNAVFIAVVLGYSLLEVCVAFAMTVPSHQYYSNFRQQVLVLSLFLLIPGLAAILSGFIVGAGLWQRRALVTITTGVVGVPLLMAVLLFYAVVLDWMFGISAILGGLLVCVLVGGTVWLLRAISGAWRRWDSQLEVKSWLVGNRGYRSRQHAIRWALWIPTLVVLCVFLFFFESWGIATHIAIPDAGEIAEYRFSIPMKWILLNHSHDRQFGSAGSSGIVGSDVQNAPRTYLSASAPISFWSIRTEECGSSSISENSSANGQHRAIRTIEMGATKFTCSELRFSDKSWPITAEVSVSCSGPDRLRTEYFGRKSELSSFYEMLGTLKYTGNAPPCPVAWEKILAHSRETARTSIILPRKR